jgi:3-methyladenine DNA glycosylase/8-oxoguanine DNA glycosylase
VTTTATSLVPPEAVTRYSPKIGVDLGATLSPLRRGAGDPTFRVDHRGIWRTVRTPDGPATLLFSAGAGWVDAAAWGPGAERAVAGVPELLGTGDDWAHLDLSSSPLLAETLRRNPGLRLPRTGLVLEAMLPAVLEQKVTGVEARRAWRYLLQKYGDKAPGPAPDGMRVFPTVEEWRRVPSWEWHRAGVGPQRSATIMRITAVASALERTVSLGRGGPAVEKVLRATPGIGIWTAAETMQRAHGDPDSPSFGDYHVPALVGWALAGHAVDDDGMAELLEPWRGDRERIVRLIGLSGVRKPARGPRMTIQDHRAH